MADTKRFGQLEQGHNGGIALSLFQPAQVLLTEATEVCILLLAETLLYPIVADVIADQLAHIHASRAANYIV